MESIGKLVGNVAIVTAAGQGLGESIAKTFAREGALVILVDINQQEILRVKEDIIEEGGRADLMVADLTKSDQVNDLVNAVVKDYKTIDILINGAGGFQKFSPINEITDSDWNDVIALNLNSAFYCSRAVSSIMIENKKGRIISLSSGAGIAPNPYAPSYIPYGAAKAGLIGMTKLMARDIGQYGITVNVIAPGTALTPRVKRIRDQESLDNIASMNPMRNLIEPKDCAEAALFLASDEARYITGITLMVNAGNLIL
ncbi:MAG: SDR family NAD(P)-dependent oxidoreductase [Alphaproteobacteria bacterium]|jgi:NAD(P)-dependent dehydrogenase (short-subunit alcohol dehydrogenase family)|nr:SDR family oxidoreductase [Hyphomicrobiales bacterium]|tara:strand:+ start:6710 stop:7480 length:771 start_codon:yes stop_codon:yes gene_type:complete